MIVPILCLVCLFFLLWVMILKGELTHLKKELENGTNRLKLSRIAARHEIHTPFGWARLRSGYYKDLSITADGKLAGMTR